MNSIKKFLLSFFLAFVSSVVLIELLGALHKEPYQDYWMDRWMQENTALEMHAQDIWKHGHSTLKRFDPSACKIARQVNWIGDLDEVTCISDDESGQYWSYAAQYGIYWRTSFFIPLFKYSARYRELKKINEKT